MELARFVQMSPWSEDVWKWMERMAAEDESVPPDESS